MRYAVRYYREPDPGSGNPSVPTFFHVDKLRATPSVERVWSLVREHAARHEWVARGDLQAVYVLEGEVGGARELLGVQVPEATEAVVCMKLRD
jgi:hypothetical protein